ncbi:MULTISPECIES: AIPR family protein [unclassified Nodularia (in: cyanobacteria)]|uniref:AIPR family protein n=1 Tax=unclassified Nodularia (in: cyanobacteria) TaxID=2656917 RepID=UPI00187E7CE9|nr:MULTISPECIES: AIPR family protein [unclassified Nodularia (in: cyanobacteria)]MBE9200661.1 AIPR family protein [Nodularia sp. LEGE 06071]MCC2695652.1 AIPR family protein [Nodularia sp. LEGE 04288]
MDRITSGLLQAFRKQQDLPDDLPDSEVFENFVNYYVIFKEHNYQFDFEDIHVGGGGDNALDGIGIIVNGSLINSQEEIEELAEKNKYLDVEFILIQSKTSSNFVTGDIAKFIIGCTEFFDENSRFPANNQIKDKRQLMEFIYAKSSLFKNRKPLCKLYYVTTGKWFDDPYLTATIDSLKKSLDNMDIFERLTFNPIDANGIQNLYRLANNKISREIKLEKRVTIHKIPDVNQAYIAIVPAKDYLKLITDDDDNIMRGLFYDNVRGFQGENDVNQEIEATIKSEESQFFVLYNNGITIVAEYINPVGDSITIRDYQIVNGCQTSYILYNSRESIKDSLYIPIKIIALDRDSKLKNNIIKANNRQTPVKLEELEALTDFQKNLEEYYNSIIESKRLYYERRPRQFNGLDDVEKIRIVDIRSQMRCFASMFLDQAHNAGRYHTKLVKETKGKIFLHSHSENPIGYYVSAYAKFCLDALFRKKQIDFKYKPFKYYMLDILRMQVAGKTKPLMTSNEFIRYCKKIEQALWDETKCKEVLLNTTTIIDKAVNGNYERDEAKTITFLNNIKSLI